MQELSFEEYTLVSGQGSTYLYDTDDLAGAYVLGVMSGVLGCAIAAYSYSHYKTLVGASVMLSVGIGIGILLDSIPALWVD